MAWRVAFVSLRCVHSPKRPERCCLVLTISSPALRSQLTLQPKWRRLANPNTRSGREIRCENSNPWDLLLETVDTWIIDWVEGGVNWVINEANNVLNAMGIGGAIDFFGDIGENVGGATEVVGNVARGVGDFARGVGDFFGRRLDDEGRRLSGPIPRFCMPNPHQPDKCAGGNWNRQWYRSHFAECENSRLQGGLDMMCYYQRVHTICTRDEYLTGYTELFSRGFESISGLQQEFATAFGSSYEVLDPTLVDLVEQARISARSGPSLDRRRDICSSASFASSLRLDQIVSRRVLCTYTPRCLHSPLLTPPLLLYRPRTDH